MYDTNKEPAEDSNIEAIFTIWVIFKTKQPKEAMVAMERIIAETVKLIPMVGRVMVELRDKEDSAK